MAVEFTSASLVDVCVYTCVCVCVCVRVIVSDTLTHRYLEVLFD